MTRKGRFGCAECSKKRRGKSFTQGVVKKVGSLAETMPELSKEWHPTKNGDLTPNDITAGKFKPVWWLCPKCGYEWQASPNNRKRGIGCPCCSGRVPRVYRHYGGSPQSAFYRQAEGQPHNEGAYP